MATQQDLIKQAMQDLGVLGNNEDPSAEDFATAGDRYTQRLEMLVDDNYADWDADSIPDAAMPGIRRVIAYEIAPMFGVLKSDLVEPDGKTLEEKGLSLLRRYMRKKASYEETFVDWF